MKSRVKLNLLFKDRVGIVADISALIAKKNLSIVSMEVGQEADNADMYLEIENGMDTIAREEILKILSRVDSLLAIKFIDTLPQEMREDRFQVVLDNIRDGVISIDTDVIGKDVKDLSLPGFAILECLRGKQYTNVKQDLITERGRFQYFITGRPITDSAGRIVGAVEIGRDMQEIRRLAQSLSQPGSATFSDFIGKSPAIMEAISFANKIARTDALLPNGVKAGRERKSLPGRSTRKVAAKDRSFRSIAPPLPEALLERSQTKAGSGPWRRTRRSGSAPTWSRAR